jgi:hypothetical protein
MGGRGERLEGREELGVRREGMRLRERERR